MTTERLVIIGGNAAGMSAASQARRRRKNNLNITVYERTPHTSYSACGMPFFVSDVIEDEDDLVIRSPEVFQEKYNIQARTLYDVKQIDSKKQQILVKNLQDDKERWESYDQLVIATGALPVQPELPGSDARGIYALSNLESGIAVKQAVEEKKTERAVIIGGGYIGMEMAEALVLRGLDVSIIEMASEIMGTLDADMGELIAETVKKHGVTLYRGEALKEIETDEGIVKAAVTNKRTIPADILIMAVGIKPDTALARDAGIALGFKDAIIVNDRMQTQTEHIWAAGDCVQSFHLMSRKPTHIALGTIANRQGRVVGANIGGDYAVFPGVMGTAITKVFDLEIGRTGLQEKEVHDLGLEHVSGKITSLTQAGYFPDAGKITVKLLAEKKTGRLLGGQIVGEQGSAKRIDTIATALHARFTVEEIINLDLSYAPPYSPVWDPVATAARKTASML